MLGVKDSILDSAAASLVPGEDFAVDNRVCSLKASKAFPEDVKDVGVGGSCIGNLGGAVGNDSSKAVQMQVSLSSFFGEKNIISRKIAACCVQRCTPRTPLLPNEFFSKV